MNDIGGKERRFLDALESLFTGAQVDGQSGFINLMRIKRSYFQSLRPQLLSAIDARVPAKTDAREELFDKLHTFFGRYFCESGSIYFRHLPALAPTYQQVYADGQDVALAWKTQDLYYVKSDTILRSMPVTLEHPTRSDQNLRFYFDASQLQHKQNNEKRELVFSFQQTKPSAKGPVLHLEVHHSQKGRKTKLEDILKQARQAQPSVRLSEEPLQKACRVFRRQAEADFFVHKDARGFLKEQWDLWMYQYLFGEETIFQEKRIQQLQAIQQTAYDIIDWIAQFEDELRRIWEKPKFTRNTHYVITLDKLPATILEKLARHKGAADQVQEWKELEMVEECFRFGDILDSSDLNPKHKHLPLDTKHFAEMKLEILATLGNLDEVLDGELVHSENWQALNTLSKRYKEKVKCIYIDPPFNLDGSDQFDYRTSYKDSCWATLLENRLALARTLLSDTGSIFVRCDYNGNWIVRRLMDNCFGEENFRNEIVIRRGSPKAGLFFQFGQQKSIGVAYDDIYWFSKNSQSGFPGFMGKPTEKQKTGYWTSFKKIYDRPSMRYELLGIPLEKGQWMWGKEKAMESVKNYEQYLRETKSTGEILDKYWVRKGKKLSFVRRRGNSIEYWVTPKESVLLDNCWVDIAGYSATTDFKTENSEVLLKRIIESTSHQNDIVLDFFLGSGTTTAVAQKLGGALGNGLELKWASIFTA